MKKASNDELNVKVYYSNNRTDIRNELKKSVLLFIEKEVKKLCAQNSWLHTGVEHIIFTHFL